MTCFNFKVTGDGTASPKGVKFPGGYDMKSPGLNWDLNSTEPYPLDGRGPPVYVSKFEADLKPNELVVVSPTGGGEEADKKYWASQDEVLKQQGATTSYFDSIGG